jgi:hypothetical protein
MTGKEAAMFETVLNGINVICSGVTFVLTAMVLISYRKPKRFTIKDQLASVALTVITLPIFILVSGARLNIWLGIVLLFLGGVFGVVRGMTVKMYIAEDEVISRNSMLSLLFWGGSVALSSLMSNLDSALLASLGLAPLVFSTGMQVAINGVMVLRRMMMKPLQTQTA